MKNIISIQGFLGSFHHTVALEYFGKEVTLLERENFDKVFEDIENGRAEYGIIAIENTIYGSLYQNYDLLLDHELSIVGEHFLRIEHNLIGFPGQKLSDIHEVSSHPVALAQCSNFLKESGLKAVETNDTAGFIKKISEEKILNVAGIASEFAAKLYGMEIYKRGVEDDLSNFTRFLIISKKDHVVESANKTSIMIELKDKAGALASVINIFADNLVNLVKIESRPIAGKPWNYRFFIDYELDTNSQKGKELLLKLREKTSSLKILGSYKNKIPYQII